MKSPRIRIWHILAAVPLMAFAAVVATMIVPKNKPLLFGLLWFQIILGAISTLALLRWVVFPILRAMVRSLFRSMESTRIHLVVAYLLLFLYLWLTLVIMHLVFAFAVFFSMLPMLIYEWMGWL